MTLSRAINVKISNGLRHFKRLGEKWDSVLWGLTKLRLDWGSIFTTVIFFWFYNSWKEFCFFKMLLFLQMMIRAVLWTIFASWCNVSNFDNCTMIRINLRDGHDTSGLTYNCITKHIVGIFEHAYNSCCTHNTIIHTISSNTWTLSKPTIIYVPITHLTISNDTIFNDHVLIGLPYVQVKLIHA